MGFATGVCTGVETCRSGVGVKTTLLAGGFFLCDRVPLLVRCGIAVPGAARTVRVAGVETGGGRTGGGFEAAVVR